MDEIWFWRRLSYADISVEGKVTIGTGERTFTLGPSVSISCGEFRCHTPELRIRTSKGADVEIVAQRYDLAVTPERFHVHGDGSLGVQWPGLAYPWVAYRLEETAPSEAADLLDDFKLLWRMLKRFRSEGYEEIARHHEVIENIVLRNSPRGRALLEYLVNHGVVTLRGDLYILNSGGLDRLGINWADLKEVRLSRQLAEFLREFARRA